jgi:FkbM family methyltransferase
MLRMGDLSADFLSIKELALGDVYKVEAGFKPDLVVDGGGNIGLFTLRAAAMTRPGEPGPRMVIVEPVPRNIAQIRKHLALNGIDAEVLPNCLGGTAREITFYCRGANESSFDSSLPYDSTTQIGVLRLQDVVGTTDAERILIKLDIEGMEIEVLDAYVPQERRAVYVVGELHDVRKNTAPLEKIFAASGWTCELFDVDTETASFRACSPAAVPLLKWASARQLTAVAT